MVLNDLGANDKAIKLFDLNESFPKLPNKLHSISGSENIVSPSFHTSSFVCK